MKNKKYCLVAGDTPFNNSLLIYETSTLPEMVIKGQIVLVPLGKRNIKACVLNELVNSLDGIEEKK